MVVLRNPVKTAVIASIGMIQTSTLPDAPRPNALTSVTVIIAAEHEHVAVREVDQLEDPVDERVAEGDQRVDHPDRQSDQEEVEEGRRVVDQVGAEPEDDQPDEDERERLHR